VATPTGRSGCDSKSGQRRDDCSQTRILLGQQLYRLIISMDFLSLSGKGPGDAFLFGR
jgi:hypothetical protein